MEITTQFRSTLKQETQTPHVGSGEYSRYRLRHASGEQMGAGNKILTMDIMGGENRVHKTCGSDMAHALVEGLKQLDSGGLAAGEHCSAVRVFIADSATEHSTTMIQMLQLLRPDIVINRVRLVKKRGSVNASDGQITTVTLEQLGAAYTQVLAQLEDKAVHYGDTLHDDLPDKNSMLPRAAALYLAGNTRYFNERWILIESGRSKDMKSVTRALEAYERSQSPASNMAAHLSHVACGLVLR